MPTLRLPPYGLTITSTLSARNTERFNSGPLNEDESVFLSCFFFSVCALRSKRRRRRKEQRKDGRHKKKKLPKKVRLQGKQHSRIVPPFTYVSDARTTVPCDGLMRTKVEGTKENARQEGRSAAQGQAGKVGRFDDTRLQLARDMQLY